MEPDSEGFRGAVMLHAGTYRISAPLVIGHSGVVLRGAGSGVDPAENTVIIAAKEVGEVSDVVLRVGNGAANWSSAEGSPVTEVVTEWVPVGNRTIEVASSDGFAAGDDIILHHPATQAWIDVVDGGAPDDPLLAASWMPSESNLDIVMKRTIAEVRGNLLVLDVPVFTHLRRDLSVVSVYKPDLSTEIRECGVEDFRLVLESDGETSTSHGFNALMFDGVENCWADGVAVLHFQKTGIGTMNSRFVTIQNAAALEPHAPIDGGYRYNFNAEKRSNFILFRDMVTSNGRHCFVANGTASVSGIVFLRGVSNGALATSEGHRRWSQGLLFDQISFEDQKTNLLLGLYNRGDWGTRHGWSAAHSVVWNSDVGGADVVIQKPPTAQNYGIAIQGVCVGDRALAGK